MKEIRRGIFIGRFQPFHKGHLSIINEMEKAENLEEIIVGIGTSQCSHTNYNPFTSKERETMIRRSVKGKKLLHIVEIPDINDFPKWVEHVEKLSPKFDVIYSGNTIVKKLFEGKGYETRPKSDNYKEINATKIRELMIRGENWEVYVPKETAKYINSIDGVKRLRNVTGKYTGVGVTVDLVVDYNDEGIVFIKRKNNPFEGYFALPGGFVEAGKESVEVAATRELLEETGISVSVKDLNLVGVYSTPGRDPRGPTVTIAYYVKANGKNGKPEAADDAESLYILNKIPEQLAFDHAQILNDCKKLLEKVSQNKNIGKIK